MSAAGPALLALSIGVAGVVYAIWPGASRRGTVLRDAPVPGSEARRSMLESARLWSSRAGELEEPAGRPGREPRAPKGVR